jgi:autotransporter-associated beta strand protein
MKNILFAFISAVAAMALHGASTVQTEGLDTTGGKTLEIASGNTLEITGKITGSGLLTTSGSGTLVLSNPENDWTGGITVGQGSRLKVTSQGALGTGKVKISHGSGSAGYVTFSAPGARFDNAIEYGRSGSEICFAADTVLAGKISIGNNDSLIYALEGVTAVIEGDIYGSNSRPLIVDGKNASCKGSIVIRGKSAVSSTLPNGTEMLQADGFILPMKKTASPAFTSARCATYAVMPMCWEKLLMFHSIKRRHHRERWI